MRFVVAVAALALLAGCGEDDEQPAATPPAATLAELTVTVDDGGQPKTAEVRCAAAADSNACRAVAAMKPRTFEPTPGNVACTELYGGPETATVKGTVRGEPVDARFSRVNGCEIARWDAARELLAAAG